MKKKLKSLKEAQEPLLRKIRSVESQLQPIEQQMKELVSTHHKPDSQESILYFLYYIKINATVFFPTISQTAGIRDATQKCKQKHDQLEYRNKEVCSQRLPTKHKKLLKTVLKH